MKTYSNIQEELSSIAPGLAKLPKPDNGDVPSGYFNNFRVHILDLVNEESVKTELETIAPTLAVLTKQHNTEVPTSYFHSFPTHMRAIVNQEASATHAPTWWSKLNERLDTVAAFIAKPKYAYAMAVAASTIIVVAMLTFEVEQCNSLECRMATLDATQIDTYMQANSDEFATDSYLDVEELSIDADPIESAIKIYSPTSEELENALLDS